jgi:hypothetical protein
MTQFAHGSRDGVNRDPTLCLSDGLSGAARIYYLFFYASTSSLA